MLTSPADASALARHAAPPSRSRRAVVGLAALAACALPVLFTLTTLGQLVGGIESDHRFHQLTGQGLLLTALWLAGLLPVVRCGWRGEAPTTATALQLVAVCAAGLLVGAVAPGHGGLALAVVAAATASLLCAVLPARPSLKQGRARIDPLLLAVAVAVAGVLAVFVADQVDLQNHASDEHAELTHYFDMAWVSVIIVLLALLGAVVRGARRQLQLATAALVYLGLVRWLLTPDVAWSVAAMSVGAVGWVTALASPRR